MNPTKPLTGILLNGAKVAGLVAGWNLVESHPVLGVASLAMTAGLIIAAAVVEEGLFLDEPEEEDQEENSL